MNHNFMRVIMLMLSACLILACTSCGANADDISDIGWKLGDFFEQTFGTSEESRYAKEESIETGNNNESADEALNIEKDFVLVPDETLAELAKLAYSESIKKGDTYDIWTVKDKIEDKEVRFSCLIFENEDSVVYAFRGTPAPFSPGSEPRIDWGQTLWYYLPPNNEISARHEQFDVLKDTIVNKVIPMLQDTDKSVFITGHSLGGWLALEAYMLVNNRLYVSAADKIKEVVTFNTIGVSKEDANVIRKYFSMQKTIVKNFYICCDIARWYGKEKGFDFPGNNFVISGIIEEDLLNYKSMENTPHRSIRIASYEYGDLDDHASDRDSTALLAELKKVKDYKNPWLVFVNGLYQPSLDVPIKNEESEENPNVKKEILENIRNFAALPPEVQYAVTEIAVRIDAHSQFSSDLLKYAKPE